MKSLKIAFCLLLIAAFANAQSSADVSNPIRPVLPDTFQNVLDLAGMTFTLPKDAIPVPVVKNKQMHTKDNIMRLMTELVAKTGSFYALK
jgi:hypothetical protein